MGICGGNPDGEAKKKRDTTVGDFEDRNEEEGKSHEY